jgi:hypothetical protein
LWGLQPVDLVRTLRYVVLDREGERTVYL